MTNQRLILSLVAVVFLATSAFNQSVGISDDGSTPDASAMLDVKSTDKGLLIPRTDTSSVNSAGSPANGLMIYTPADQQYYYYNGSRWLGVTDGLTDKDGDTKVEVERFNDDDKVRVMVEGVDALTIQKGLGNQLMFHMPFNKRNVFLGQSAGNNTGLDSTFVNSGHLNTGVGFNALYNNTNGLTNTAFGGYALLNNTTGVNNTATGVHALEQNISGDNNAVFGVGAMRSNTTGFDNVAVGLNALNSNITGFNSVSVGRRAGVFDTISIGNVYIGTNAGAGGSVFSDRHAKSNNVMIGYNAGEQNQGDANIFLGYEAGQNEASSNRLYIENSNGDMNNALIYGEFDNNILRVNGKVGIGAAPSDALHISGSGLEDLFRVQLGGSTKMRVYNNGSISLGNNNTNISNGDVYVHNDLGIGAGIPENRLHVKDSDDGAFMAKIENFNTGTKSSGLIVEVGPNSNPTNTNIFIGFQDQDGTNVGSVTGNGSGGILYNTTSDIRLKQNINPFLSGLDLINKINAYNYEMKSNPGVDHIGFIAQELYKVLPNIVKGTPESTSVDDPMMVDYSKMTPILVAAVKELSDKNILLEKEIRELKNATALLVEMQSELMSQKKLISELVQSKDQRKSIKGED